MTGPIINAAAVAAGSLVGAYLSRGINASLRKNINNVFGCITLALGVYMVAKTHSMPPVVIAVLMGTAVGLPLRLDTNILRLAFWAVGKFKRGAAGSPVTPESVFRDQFSVVTVLFCFSVLGTLGPLQEGMTGDYSLLFIKALLDFVTAMIFAANIGGIVGVLALPQFLLQASFFLAATAIVPLTTDAMVADFSSCGGIIMLGTGLRQLGLAEVPILSTLPSLFIIMPFSALWTHFVG